MLAAQPKVKAHIGTGAVRSFTLKLHWVWTQEPFFRSPRVPRMGYTIEPNLGYSLVQNRGISSVGECEIHPHCLSLKIKFEFGYWATMNDKLYVFSFLFDFPISVIPSIHSCCVLIFFGFYHLVGLTLDASELETWCN